MKEQIFKYRWGKPGDGSVFVSSRDICHAIGNSDQYPVEPIGGEKTPEREIQDETLFAVIAAIETAPRYLCRTRLMIDAEKAAGMIRELEGKPDGENIPLDGIADLLMESAEWVATVRRESSCSICDDCETGRERGCSHAKGRHYDAWGEGLGKPDFCPQNGGDLPW